VAEVNVKGCKTAENSSVYLNLSWFYLCPASYSLTDCSQI